MAAILFAVFSMAATVVAKVGAISAGGVIHQVSAGIKNMPVERAPGIVKEIEPWFLNRDDVPVFRRG
jgi:hypothetical protein